MLKSKKEKLGYAVGIEIGKSINKNFYNIDHPALFQGIKDGLSEKKPMLSQDEMQKLLVDFEKQLIAKKAEDNLKAGQKFLEDNSTQTGVVTLPKGLQYKVLKSGSGHPPKIHDTVVVHYRGHFVDGTVFESTYEHNKPQTFHVDGVIQGWTEALMMMKPGDIWEIYIPPHLAYGEQGKGNIEPNTTLVFQIELLKVVT